MHVATLFAHARPRPTPVVGPKPVYTCIQRAIVTIPRAVCTGIDKLYCAHGGATIEVPLFIWVNGVEYLNPGLVGLYPGAPIEIWRDGHRKVVDGWFDYPDMDTTTGWVTLHVVDQTKDWDKTNHGTGSKQGWSVPPITGVDQDPDLGPIVLGGWDAVNATGGSGISPWGYAEAVGYGSERTNPWHFKKMTLTVDAGKTLKASLIVNVPVGTQVEKVLSCNLISPDAPTEHQNVGISIPSTTPPGEWSDVITINVEGPCTTNIAVWSPMQDKGETLVSMRLLLTNSTNVDNPDNPTEITSVPHGGLPVDMAALLARESFNKIGQGANVQNLGGGTPLTDGVWVTDDDLSTYGSLISQWDSMVEWWWVPETKTAVFAGIGTGGRTFDQIRVVTRGRSRAYALGLTGSSRNVARFVTITKEDGDRNFRYTWDSGIGRAWELVDTAPAGLDPSVYAVTVQAQAANAAQPVTCSLLPPPGGRCAADWLDIGLNVGDRVPTYTESPFYDVEHQRITGMHIDPQNGDDLKLVLEPRP